MTEPIAAGITTMDELMAALKIARKRRAMPQWLVDEISGLQHSYTFKLESGQKGLGKVSLPLLCGALACEIWLMPASSQHPKNVSAPVTSKTGGDYFKRRAQRARMVQIAKTPPRKRRALAQAAARARWDRKRERERHSAATSSST